MNLRLLLLIIFSIVGYYNSNAQYVFKGYVENANENSTAYLSLINDYRKIYGVYEEQIINRVKIIDNYFEFTGDNLNTKNRLYRIHIDNCSNEELGKNHFNGKCEESSQIVFIANNMDIINFPSSFEDQMFCSIESNNPHTKALFSIDSLKELMTYDYGNYRSEASRKLNNKKWFNKFQEFGKGLKEPLAELYIYNFLSERSSELHSYYREDIISNSFYEDLQDRLNEEYPNSDYAIQYGDEIASDRYIKSNNERTFKTYIPILLLLLLGSGLFNFYLWNKLKKTKHSIKTNGIEDLTKQEKKILDLILNDKTNKEIAQEIFVSVSTVKTHINNLYKKLNVTSRDEVKLLFNS